MTPLPPRAMLVAVVSVAAPLLLAQAPPSSPPPSSPPPAAPAEGVGPEVTLDLAAFLTSQTLFSETVGDQVWKFAPQPGRRLILLPLRVEPGEASRELDDPGVTVRGGRFLAWHVNPQEQADPRDNVDPADTDAVRERQSVGGLLLQDNDFDLGGRVTTPEQQAAMQGAGAVAGVGAALPADAPTFARSITIEPDGTVKWELARSLGNATVAEVDNDYTLKLRADRLRAKEPARPQQARPQAGAGAGGGADARAAAEQRRQAEAEYRAQVQAFRELQARVRAAPERFEVDLPQRLYAVYEISETAPQFALAGPSPLPWTLKTTDLNALRALAATTGGGSSGLSQEQSGAVGTLAALARDNHPLTHEAIALALRRINAAAIVAPNDTLYGLMKSVINGPSAEARRSVLADLVTTVPPTQATATLLRESASQLTPDLQIASLRSMLQADPSNQAAQREMLGTVNRALADPDGPDPGVVLGALAEQGRETNPGQPTTAAATSPTQAIVTGVQFETLPPARRDAAIAYVIRAAGTEPVADAWLARRLLGSTDQGTSRRTLELLAQAGPRSAFMRPAARRFVRLIAGAAAEGAQRRLDLTLSGLVPLTPNHPYFLGLQSGDPAMRALAWQALPNFRVGAEASQAGMPTDPAATPPADEVVRQVMRLGLASQAIPPQLVTFLSRQSSDAAIAGLAQLAIVGDANIGRQAARALYGSERETQLSAAMQAMSPSDRAAFASRVYAATRGGAPLVAGLLGDDDPSRTNVAGEFGALVAAGTLPTPAELAAKYGIELDLLTLAAKPDPTVAAGAVAGLVAIAGGSEEDAQTLAARFRDQSDRSVGALTQLWGPAKREIYARKLAEAAGSYRLSVNHRPPEIGFGGMPQGQALPEHLQPRNVVVGVVDLGVEGAAAFLGNRTVNFTVPDDRLALRLTTPTDLANFPNADLGGIPLAEVQGPLDLLPQDGRVWRGEAMTTATGTLEVVLEPMAVP